MAAQTLSALWLRMASVSALNLLSSRLRVKSFNWGFSTGC